MATLIERINLRAHDPKRAIQMNENCQVLALPEALIAFPPISLAAVEAAERELGFKLPAFLRELYTQVGNGNFGPGYGLLHLTPQIPDLPYRGFDTTLVQAYHRHFDNPAYPWPQQLLLLCDWGCGIGSYVDWTRTEAPVFRYDPNEDDQPDDPTRWRTDGLEFQPEATSIQRWFEAWVDNRLEFYPLLGE